MKKIYPVILCGGNGQRLWPLSGYSNPKPFLNLFGEKTLFQETLERLALDFLQPPIIVCQEKHVHLVSVQLQEISCAYSSIILEKSAKNTMTAALLAVQWVSALDKDAGIILFPADHYFENYKKVERSIINALNNYNNESIVVFGHIPDSPHTGYGYIKPSKEKEAFLKQVDVFTEKPCSEVAKQYVDSGEYLWNMGIFMANVDVILNESMMLCPEYYTATKKAICEASFDNMHNILKISDACLKDLLSVSLDHALIEKSKKIMVSVVGDAGWKDIGTWSSLSSVRKEKEKTSNVTHGDNINLHSCEDCFVMNHATDIKININGMKNKNIILSNEGLLVESSLTNKKDETLLEKEIRPWGEFKVLDRGKNYLVKKIVVNPLSKLSLQKHQHRSEKWIITEGKPLVTKGNSQFFLSAGDTVFIEKNEIHRIENTTHETCTLIEIQNGDILDESDIQRIEDDYGRI